MKLYRVRRKPLHPYVFGQSCDLWRKIDHAKHHIARHKKFTEHIYAKALLVMLEAEDKHWKELVEVR